HAKRQSPGELLGFNEKSRAEPPKTRNEVTKTPPPANREGAARRRRRPKAHPGKARFLPRVGTTVDEPDGSSHWDHERRKKVEGRHCKRAHRARHEGNHPTPPARSEDNCRGEREHKGFFGLTRESRVRRPGFESSSGLSYDFLRH